MDKRKQKYFKFIHSFSFTDFGFAHYLIGETETSYLRGSLLYMAPEIVIKRQYNEQADLWSVGVILYGALSSTLVTLNIVQDIKRNLFLISCFYQSVFLVGRLLHPKQLKSWV